MVPIEKVHHTDTEGIAHAQSATSLPAFTAFSTSASPVALAQIMYEFTRIMTCKAIAGIPSSRAGWKRVSTRIDMMACGKVLVCGA